MVKKNENEKEVSNISCDLQRYKRETENLRVSFDCPLKPDTMNYFQTAARQMREEEGRLDRAWGELEEEGAKLEHQARVTEEEADRLEREVERQGGIGETAQASRPWLSL